jgi:hypothetical protein
MASGRFAFFLAWSFLALSPCIDLLPLEGLSRAMGTKDFQPRYAMLACVAFSWAAAAGIQKGWERGGLMRRAAGVFLLVLGLFAVRQIWNTPMQFRVPPEPLPRLFSMPFVRWTEPKEYEAWLKDFSKEYGTAPAAAFEGVFGSGLVYEDPDVAAAVRRLVYAGDLYMRRQDRLPQDFLDGICLTQSFERDWSEARERLAQGQSDPDLPALARVLFQDPHHVAASLASSALLLRAGRPEAAGRLYQLARQETGLGHAAMMTIACASMRPVCDRLGLMGDQYRRQVQAAGIWLPPR